MNNININNININNIYKILYNIFAFIILLIFVLASIFPFLWLVFGAFKSMAEISKIPPTFIPTEWKFNNIEKFFTTTNMNIALCYYNSLFISVINVVFQLFTSALIGYIFAKFNFKGKKSLFWIIVSSMMLPFQVTMIPQYLMLSNFGLINSHWGLIIPVIINAFGIFLMKQFSQDLPDSYLDSARIEGASEFQIFLKIVLPQLLPALSTLGMFIFIYNWNSFLWPMIILKSKELSTLPIGLFLISSDSSNKRLDLVFAGALLIMIPMLIIFILAQKWVIKGFTMSGLKE